MSRLAIHGGAPVRTRGFSSWPVFDHRELEAARQVIESGRWWRYSLDEAQDLQGERSQVALFQEEFARYQGAGCGVAVANGSVALDIAVRALDIGPGMEVIVPGYTYVTGVTCVLQSNAVPVFVDISPDTYNIDPDAVERAVSERTAAVLPCHFGGQVADMDRLQEICRRRGLRLLEDAAHAQGSRWKGRGAGAIGAAGVFSFQNAKNMTAGEGGLITTDDPALAERMQCLAWAGRRRGRPWYEFHELGWNARLTELQAAMLRVQLTRLEEQNRRRRENAAYLTGRLQQIGGLEPVRIDPRGEHWSVHIFMIRYDPQAFGGLPRARLLEAVNAEGIPAISGYTHAVYANPMFREQRFYGRGCPVSCGHYGRSLDYAAFAESCPVCERACASEALWLEHRLFLGTREDMDSIAEAFSRVKEHAAELL